jgi:hypothetical protein
MRGSGQMMSAALEHLLYALVHGPDLAACIRAVVLDQYAE